MKTDVVIVGAGPAGMFAAHELAAKSNLKITVIDWGPDVPKRKCPVIMYSYCSKCKPCKIMCGVGGAGTLSSGLLNLRPDIGGNLKEFASDNEAWKLVKEVDEVFVKYGAPQEIYRANTDQVESLMRKAAAVGIEFVPIPQRHIGTDNAPKVITKFKKALEQASVKFILETKVTKINKSEIELENGQKIQAKYIIVAPGRIGAKWLQEQAKKLGIKTHPQPIDVGVRVEVPAVVMEPIIKIARDPKFRVYTKTFDDLTRVFCVNYQGFVVQEVYGDIVGVNGHTLLKQKSGNANFAFLVRVELTEPLEDTTAYGYSIAKLATTIGGGKPILQRLGDLKKGRRSTWSRIDRSNVKPTLRDVTPGDVAMALPHRIVTDILEGLEKLDHVIPGVASSSTLIYAPEIKFYANRIEVNKNLETSVENIFVAGDGAGLSRGIVVAAATGILAARGVLKKEGVI